MSNGWGTIFLFLFGVVLMIVGILLMVGSSMIKSEEGLNVTLNETTPEGKTVDFIQSTTFWIGMVLFIFGIVIIIFGFFVGSK